MKNSIPMTKIGHQLLKEELEQLIKVERVNITNAISEARAHGDLKENADYHAAKEKQSHVEGRILEIQGKLAQALIVDVGKLSGDRIVFGAIVDLIDTESEKNIRFQIVGEDEAARFKDKISFNSPLGKALIGKDSGDSVVVDAPKGEIEYEVENIEYK